MLYRYPERSVSMAARHPQLGWASWLALLFALAFSGICAAAWANSDQIVVWLLSRGLIDEAGTSTLPGVIQHAAMGVGVAGLVVASLIALRGVFDIYPWTPVLSPVPRAVYAVLFTLSALGASVAHHASMVASPIIRGIWTVVDTTLLYTRKGLAFSLSFLQTGLSVSICRMGEVLALALRTGWAVISIPLVYAAIALYLVGLALGRPIAILGYQLRRAVLAMARVVESTGLHLGRGTTAILEDVAGVLGMVLRTVWIIVSTPFRYASKGAVLTWGYLWTGVTAVLRHLGHAVTAILEYVARVLGMVLGTVWVFVYTPFRYALKGAVLTWRYLWTGVAAVLRHLGRGTTTILEHVARVLGMVLRTVWVFVYTPFHYALKGLVLTSDYVRTRAAALLRHLNGALMTSLRLARTAVSTTVQPVQHGALIVAGAVKLAVGLALHAVATGLGLLFAGVSSVAQPLGLLASSAMAGLVGGVGIVGLGLAAALRPIWLGITGIVGSLRLTVTALMGLLQRVSSLASRAVDRLLSVVRVGIRSLAYAAGLLLRGVSRPVFLASRHLRMGASTIALLLGWLIRSTWLIGLATFQGLSRAPVFVARTMWTGAGAVPDVGKAAVSLATDRKGVIAMSDHNLTRQRVLSLIGTLWVLGIMGSLIGWTLWPTPPEPTVEVEHWATGHLMREGEDLRLLPVMAEQFNNAGHRNQAGTRIVVKVHNVPSQLIGEYLVARVKSGRRIDLTGLTDGYVKPGYSDPTVVTPSSAHWLVTVNHQVERDVVDLGAARSIVRPVIGIVTYEEMARCLGWPEKELGYADILALRADPEGWTKYSCASPLWGPKPLVAFTDPTTSSTGRSLLLGLYSIAAGVPPEELTTDHVNDPAVAGYVKQFQGLVDHYLIGTTVLNTKIYQGPRYGQFFIMPEDNLIHLYEGTERAFINGIKVQAPRIAPGSMVMIYPKEGSMPRSNCACIVRADWVTPEQVEAAQQWIDYLLEDEQQRSFMAAGFRPGGDISLTDPSSKINARYGLDPAKPTATLNPSLIDPAAAAGIDKNWQLVKRPGIVTFVVDTSGSMMGSKIDQARDGLVRALHNMAKNNQVGLVGFGESIHTRVPVAPLAKNGFRIADAAHEMRARGETALYDAIKAGVEMSDAAEGPKEAIRAVVVLTDGRANRGEVKLHDLIRMSSRDERPVPRFTGFDDESWAEAAGGERIEKADLIGDELAVAARHPIQIFFIGIGDDADLDVGRILAEATGAEFQGVMEKDLAAVLEEFSKYF